MPILGYGVFQVTNEECERCVLDAVGVGYRSIDTAQAYGNEEAVGRAVVKCGVPRDELFLTMKVWISNGGYEKAKASIEESLKKLQTDYLDLLLIHQLFNDYYGTYRAMEEAYTAGKLRAIMDKCCVVHESWYPSLKDGLFGLGPSWPQSIRATLPAWICEGRIYHERIVVQGACI